MDFDLPPANQSSTTRGKLNVRGEPLEPRPQMCVGSPGSHRMQVADLLCTFCMLTCKTKEDHDIMVLLWTCKPRGPEVD